MIGVPLVGYIVVSDSSRRQPIHYLGLFDWPLLPLGVNKALVHTLGDVQGWLACSTIGLLVLHIGSALKHRLINRDGVIARMIPFAR
jgi:cytochrome b561